MSTTARAKAKPAPTRPMRARHVDQPARRPQAAQGGEVEQLRLLMAKSLEATNRKIADLEGENKELRAQVDTLTADLATRTQERDAAIAAYQNDVGVLAQALANANAR